MSISQQNPTHHPDVDEYPEPPHEEYSERVPAARRASPVDRMPPQDLDAEQSVLGGMLLSKNAIGDVVEQLGGPEDFYRPAHQTVYEAILTLYAKGEPADPITVGAELNRTGDLHRIGGQPYLHTLVQAVPTAANAGYYAETVAERAIFRRLAETGTIITQDGYRAEGEAVEVVDRAQSLMFKVMGDRTRQDALPLSATGHSLVDRLQQRKARGDGLQGLGTGFTDFDALTNGLLGGQFIVIAARPSMGKTTLALDFVRNCSVKQKLPSALFSLEMGREEIEERILSAEARVAFHHMKSGTITEEDWTRIARRMDDINSAPLYIDDAANQTYMEIAAKARRLKQKHDIQLLVIDYLQLMKSGGRAETRQQEVSDMSRNLKLLAKDLKIPVIALSQLNRGPEQRTDKKPMVSDLRESGAIEQDADMVILLHREDHYDKESPRAGEADLIVAKHRNGPTATVTVAFQGHYCRFVDMAQN